MSSLPAELIRGRGLAKSYQTNGRLVQALTETDLMLGEGETVALVGPSGCGKTTVLLLLAGLERPSSGSVEFKGSPLGKPHKEIALVLQDYGLFPWKTVRENVELGLRIRGEQIDRGKVNSLLEELDILDKARSYPQQLSGGQKQRVALARALVLNPALLLLDEPFAALDTLTRERLQDLLAAAWRARKFGMVLVTHNIQEAVRLGGRVLVMSAGPGRILSVIDNHAACSLDYDSCGAFSSLCREVRRGIEEGS
ncbi:MAG: ATP-binding cassette domain-containing protein [Pseudomonadota bacterium]